MLYLYLVSVDRVHGEACLGTTGSHDVALAFAMPTKVFGVKHNQAK